ncbi:MAG: SDR family NAD(P)-dependent oxidoreductase [Rhizobiaceae bacterium]
MEKLVCHEASEEDYLHGGGSLPLFLNGAELSEKYPDLARVVCPLQIAQIIATSRLVGMQLPGLHSLYNGLSVEFSQSEPDAPSELTYQTLRYLPRYKRLKLSLASAGLTGTLEASVRPTPITQPKMAHITNLVQSKAWKSKRAIVIGGSRGLGEAAAKILAAAGAEVLITYLAGENDANAVAEDIRSAGGCAEVLRYDVLKPNEPDFKKLAAFGPDLVCYFATPKILLNTSGFSESKHDFYAQYFVTGMWNLVTGFLGANTGPFRLFNPSTNYIDNVVPGALEYAMAKADSEVLCNYMAEEFNNVSCCSRRLPPIKTDQSVSLLHKEVGDAVSELLPILLGDARSV